MVLVAGAFLGGFAVNQARLPGYGAAKAVYDRVVGVKDALTGGGERSGPEGRWRRAPDGGEGSGDAADAVERLESLGYASGTRAADGSSGISAFDSTRAWNGPNLVVSGHAPEAILTDMHGRALHRWSLDFWSAFPDTDVPRDREPAQFWRRAWMLPGGDLLAIFEGHGLIRVDRDSQPVWTYDGRAHHDLDFADDGRIWVLTRKVEFLPRIHPDKPVLEDFVTVLEPDGTTVREISVLEAFERSDYRSLTEGRPPAGDIFHTNSLEILDGRLADRIPAFRAGNLLISLHTVNVIAVLDPEAERIVWALAGMWKRQHDPQVLDDGSVMVFDNQGRAGSSRVLLIDPVTQAVTWEYAGDPPESFYTELCGAAQRLPNGNTLITESESGARVRGNGGRRPSCGTTRVRSAPGSRRRAGGHAPGSATPGSHWTRRWTGCRVSERGGRRRRRAHDGQPPGSADRASPPKTPAAFQFAPFALLAWIPYVAAGEARSGSSRTTRTSPSATRRTGPPAIGLRYNPGRGTSRSRDTATSSGSCGAALVEKLGGDVAFWAPLTSLACGVDRCFYWLVYPRASRRAMGL